MWECTGFGMLHASGAGQSCVHATEQHESRFWTNVHLWFPLDFRLQLMQELDSMIFMGSLQLRLIYDSVIFQADTCLKQVGWL